MTLIAGRGEPGDRHVATVGAQGGTVDRACGDAPVIVMDCYWLGPLAAGEPGHIDVANLIGGEPARGHAGVDGENHPGVEDSDQQQERERVAVNRSPRSSWAAF